ncbi:hypothetical protein EDC94DRAFT_647177, partial [Helicostylum pulchrum]
MEPKSCCSPMAIPFLNPEGTFIIVITVFIDTCVNYYFKVGPPSSGSRNHSL